VADGTRAQVYVRSHTEPRIPISGNTRPPLQREKIELELVPVENMQWESESPQDYEIGNDLPDKVFERENPAHHIAVPHINICEELKLRLMCTIADGFQMACDEKPFDRLVLVAPPKLLGELKKRLNEKTLEHVVAKSPKELTHLDVDELAGQLKAIL